MNVQAETKTKREGRPPPSLQWVDPAKINLIYGAARPREVELADRRSRQRRVPLRQYGRQKTDVLDGDWDEDVRNIPFTELDEYRGLVEHVHEGAPWEETRYWAWAERRVSRAIRKGRKTPEAASDSATRWVERFQQTYDSIAAHGYKTQVELGTGSPRHEIEVAINREGRYIFVDGRHRLAVARALGVDEVPVWVIVRHAEWEAFRERVLAEGRGPRGILYHQVDHPDLRDIPAQHEGTGRLDLVLKALEGYDADGKHLLDIGANWGQVSQQVAKLGFCVTGLEASLNHASIAEKLRVASESPHRIVWGSFFDFPDVEHQDVILALNVFHHLIATQDRYERLLKVLPRVRADVMVFEPHRSLSSPEFMTRAYKNFGPDDFAQFVADHTGLSEIELQGAAPDGRAVYKLTRG